MVQVVSVPGCNLGSSQESAGALVRPWIEVARRALQVSYTPRKGKKSSQTVGPENAEEISCIALEWSNAVFNLSGKEIICLSCSERYRGFLFAPF